MRLVIFLLGVFLSSFAFAQNNEPNYRILKKYPEDKRGFNIKAYWEPVEGASSYRLRVFRKTPTDFDSQFLSHNNFFYFKLYPWRLYKWDIQAIDSNGQPMAEPIAGPDIYLESTLYPKPEKKAEVISELQEEDEQDDVLAQSYVTENGETELVDTTTTYDEPLINESPQEDEEIRPEPEVFTDPMIEPNIESESEVATEDESEAESQQEQVGEPYEEKYLVGFGLGATSFTYEQSVAGRVDLDFSSFKLPSYHLFFKGQWGRILGEAEYKVLPGNIDSSQSINGGSDTEVTQIIVAGGYRVYNYSLFGFNHTLATLLSYNINSIPLIYVDTLDNLHRLVPGLTTVSLGLRNTTLLSEQFTLPIELRYSIPMATTGDSGSFEVNSGQILSASIGLQWHLWQQISIGLLLEADNYSLDYQSDIAGDIQQGSLTYTILNSEAQVIYRF